MSSNSVSEVMIFKPTMSDFSFSEIRGLGYKLHFRFHKRRTRIQIHDKSYNEPIFDELVRLPCSPSTFKGQVTICKRIMCVISQKSIRPYLALAPPVNLASLILQEMKNFPHTGYNAEYFFCVKGKLKLKLGNESPLVISVDARGKRAVEMRLLSPWADSILLLIEFIRRLSSKFDPSTLTLSGYEESYFRKDITLKLKYLMNKRDLVMLDFLKKVDTKNLVEFFRRYGK